MWQEDEQFASKGDRQWIGVDLDGTLAKRNGGAGKPIGAPVPAMAARIARWLEDGREVRIFTARAGDPKEVRRIKAWLIEHELPSLKITNKKDLGMGELWDDRAVRVEIDKGTPCRACAAALAAAGGQFTEQRQREGVDFL